MAMGRPKAVLVLDAEQREQLESFANSRGSAGWTGASGQDHFAECVWEDEPWAFVWTATAESIFAKVERLCEGISGTAH